MRDGGVAVWYPVPRSDDFSSFYSGAPVGASARTVFFSLGFCYGGRVFGGGYRATYGGDRLAAGLGDGITQVSVNQNLRVALNLKIDPNIQPGTMRRSRERHSTAVSLPLLAR